MTTQEGGASMPAGPNFHPKQEATSAAASGGASAADMMSETQSETAEGTGMSQHST